MFTFYLFSFIPVLFFSLLLWSDVYKKEQYRERPRHLLVSLIILSVIGVFLTFVYFNFFNVLFTFSAFCIALILYLVSFFYLEYSVHSQRILRSFLMSDFKKKLKTLYTMIAILILIIIIAVIIYINHKSLLEPFTVGTFKDQSIFSMSNGILLLVFGLVYGFINLFFINKSVFNLQEGVIRKEDILFSSLGYMMIFGMVVFYFYNGFGTKTNYYLFGIQIKGFAFESFLILNIIYSIRLYLEYFFRRIYNSEKIAQKLNESSELKNYLINLVLSSPIEEDINIIRSTIETSLEKSFRNLVVSEYRITGTYVLRRNENILRVDSRALIRGYCVPLTNIADSNIKKKTMDQLNDMITGKSYDLNKLRITPAEYITDWGEQLVKEVMDTKNEVIVKKIPKGYLGLQRFIGLFPVISADRLDGIIVVFKEAFEELLPEERHVLKDLIDDLRIIFSITDGKRVQADKNRLQTEMNTARLLQTSMVPRKINIEGYDCACFMETATEVGGDAYDHIKTKNGNYFGIGDVSGHGLPAGLCALIQQAAFQAAVTTAAAMETQIEPYTVYNVVNKVLCEINTKRIGSDKFMTQNYLYEENGKVTYAGAHEIALLYYDKEEKVIELADLTRKTAYMGFSPHIDAKGSAGSLYLGENDILVLYSDGVIQAKDHYNHQYGLENFKHLILTNSKLSSEELINKIVLDVKIHATDGDIKKYGGHLADDITLLVIKRLKK